MASRTNGDSMPILKRLYVYWRIIGLCPFVPVGGNEILRFSYIGVFYTITITLTYVAIYFRAIINRMNFVLSRETLMTIVADFSGVTAEFLVVITGWLCFSFRQAKIKRIIIMFKKIHTKLRNIGINEDFKKIVKTAQIHTASVNLVWFFLYCCDHVLLIDCQTFSLAIWMPFNFPRVVTHNVMVMFIDAMLIVNRFFCRLNDRIDDLSSEVATRSCAIVDEHRSDSTNDGLESFVKIVPMEAYGKIHSDLVSLTRMIVKFFSLSIILTLLVHSIQMSTDLYIVCLMARDTRFFTRTEICKFIILCCYISIHMGETVVIMAIADETAKEANRAGSVLHKMLTSRHSKRYSDSGQILSIRLLQRRLKIDVYGLFELRLSLVHRFVGMVATYIMIMLQLDTQDIQREKIDRSLEEPFGSEGQSFNDTSTMNFSLI